MERKTRSTGSKIKPSKKKRSYSLTDSRRLKNIRDPEEAYGSKLTVFLKY